MERFTLADPSLLYYYRITTSGTIKLTTMSVSRPAGSLEQYSIYRKILGSMAPVVVLARYSKPLTKEVLYPALMQLIANQPLLGITCMTENTIPSFVKINSIDLERVVAWSDQALETLVNDQFTNTDIAYNQLELPLWRLIVTTDNFALFVFDHGPFDGNSGAYFHQLLLEQLNSLSLSEESKLDSVVPTSSLDLNQNFERVADIKPPWYMLFSVLASSYLGKLWPASVQPMSLPVKYPHEAYSVFDQFDPIKSRKFLELSRANGVTLTGLLVVILARTVAELVPDDQLDVRTKSANIEFSIDINARGRAPMKLVSDNLILGNYVYTYDDKINVQKSVTLQSTFDQAKTVINNLKSQIQSFKSAYTVGLLQYIDVYKYLIKNKEKLAARRTLIEVSNLGAFPAGDGDWKLTDMAFSQANTSNGASYTLNMASIRSESIWYSISLATKDQAQVRQFADRFKQNMEQLLEQS